MHWRSHVHTSRQTLQEFCIVLLLKNHLLTINFSWIWACGIILFSRPTYMRIVPRQVDWQTSSLKNHVLTIKFSWICWGEPCNTLSMVHTGERQSSLYCIILFSLQSNFLEFVGENPGGGQFIRYEGGTSRKPIPKYFIHIFSLKNHRSAQAERLFILLYCILQFFYLEAMVYQLLMMVPIENTIQKY
jgi:hypothetical protein